MRTRIHTLALLALAALFIVVSCTSESVADSSTDDLNVEYAKSENAKMATRAIRGKVNNGPNENFDPFICDTPVGPVPLTTNNIYGNMTHLGKLQPGSLGVPTSCVVFDITTFTLETTYEVNYIGAHGDEIRTFEHVFLTPTAPDFSTGVFTGTITIIGGTGRFENATGFMEFVDANWVGVNSTWGLVGEITY